MIHKKKILLVNTRRTWIRCSFFVVLFFSCQEKINNGIEIEKAILQQYTLVKDTSNFTDLFKVVEQLNCIVKNEIGRRLVFANQFNPKDSSHILVIPFSSVLGDFSSCAYSDIDNDFILLSPELIESFNNKNTLNNSTSLPAVLSIILLHEMGHFALQKEGAFDVIEKKRNTTLGEQKMNTTPEYLTISKKIEMSADSTGVTWVKKYFRETKDMNCFSIASEVERVLPGIQFEIFGRRLLENFGSTSLNLLRDPSRTHPNLELRIAFMNYYLNETPQQKEMIDAYLYEREVAPIHRQEFDPRIFQGNEKTIQIKPH